MMKHQTLFLLCMMLHNLMAQPVAKTMKYLPDTGEKNSYTNTFGEDHDYNLYAPFYLKNGNGTITDTNTTLMWQQKDGGEMTFEKAQAYVDTLTLGGYTDWRLPSPIEAFSILNMQYTNPAIDTSVFTYTLAEYWWTGIKDNKDSQKVWVTNAGGGIGNHPKIETISAGGNKRMHVRAVRDTKLPISFVNHFATINSTVVHDSITGLEWTNALATDSMTWEDALIFAESSTAATFSDWRLPNIKELQSLTNATIPGTTISTAFFTNVANKKIWSSTTLPNQTAKAWYLDAQVGITTYADKTAKLPVLLVRTLVQNTVSEINQIHANIHTGVKAEQLSDLVPDQTSVWIIINESGRISRVGKGKRVEMDSLPVGLYIFKVLNEKDAVVSFIKTGE